MPNYLIKSEIIKLSTLFRVQIVKKFAFPIQNSKNKCLFWHVKTPLQWITNSIHCSLEWELIWWEDKESTSKSPKSDLLSPSCLNSMEQNPMCQDLQALLSQYCIWEEIMVLSKSYWYSKTFHQLKRKIKSKYRFFFSI